MLTSVLAADRLADYMPQILLQGLVAVLAVFLRVERCEVLGYLRHVRLTQGYSSRCFLSCFLRYSAGLFFSDFLSDCVYRYKPVALAFVRDIAHLSRHRLRNIRALQYLFVRLDK